jgi:ATP-dependent helicase/nuclease subunit B
VGGLRLPDMSVFGKIMLLKQIFEENKDKLKIFGSSYRQTGFLKEFGELVAEFKQNLVDGPSLNTAGAKVEDELLKRKISDIELIYSEFVKRTQGKYFDEEDKTNLFISLIKESAYIRNSKIWIDGFESFNRQRLGVIKALCDFSKSVTLSLNIDSSYLDEPEDKDYYEAFKIIHDTYLRLKNLDEDIEIVALKQNKSSSPEIKALEKNIFALNIEEYKDDTDNIAIYSSLNPYTETQRTAAKIISLVRDKGYRWRDIKVAVGSMDTYERNVKRVFAQYEIPCFLDVKRDILNNPLSKYILSILDIFIWKFKHDHVFEYLKTGFSPLSINQVHCLENYALRYGIEGEKWFKEFTTNEYDNYDIEEYRRLFAGDFEAARKEVHKLKTVNEITRLIFKFLDRHKIKEKMDKAVKGFNAIRKFEEASEYSQCWNYTMEIFEQLLLVGQDTEISIKEYRKILEAGLAEVEISIIPPAIDKVEVGEIDRIAVTKPKALFLLGANAANLDSKNTEKGLLLNEERDLLLKNDVKLTKGGYHETFKEKHMLYKLFSSPGHTLSVSYPLGLATGESLQPSLYLDILKRVFVRVKEGSDLSMGDELEFVSNCGGTYDYLVARMRDYIDGYETDNLWKDVYAWYEKNDRENFNIINKALQYKNSVKALEPDMVKTIYENNMTMTVSKLETYAECGFRYFLENVLRPKERPVQKIEFYDLGNIYHSVVEKFIDKVKEEYKDISLIDGARAEEEAAKITEDVLSDQADKVTALEANHRNKYMKEKIKRVMKRTCRTLVRQLMFPMLFVIVACGAISGFHSLVGSGTTSKQVDNEKDTKLIGYGAMLIEGVLAVIALITAAYVSNTELTELLKGGPVNVFSSGVGTFMSKFGIPFDIGKSFVALAVSAFALTSLDTATRLGRFIFQEFFDDPEKEKPSVLTNMYVSTAITVLIGGYLAAGGYAKIWPIFGSANQLLAALSLLAIAVWLKKVGRNYHMLTIPMIFMLVVTLTALVLLIKSNLAAGNYILVVFPVLLFILAIILAKEGYSIIFGSKDLEEISKSN